MTHPVEPIQALCFMCGAINTSVLRERVGDHVHFTCLECDVDQWLWSPLKPEEVQP